ncbi:MAG TPA: hypothetical protein VGC76_14945 [Pyrinomonadaceae bacterium]|jgi:hypothetical protein
MKNEKFEVGQTMKTMCSACDVEQNHIVETISKQGQVTKSACEVCGTANTFSRGVKTSVTMSKGKSASPYDRTRKYRKGQAMTHTTFGQGEVTAVIEPQKIDVLFGDRTRRLIHAQD